MIYLIESSGYSVDDKDTINYFRLLKIGYTEDNCRDGRFTAYKLHNPDSIDCTFRSLHLDYFCYFIDKDGYEQVTEIIENIDQLLCYSEESWNLGDSDEVEKLCEYFLSNQ